MVGNSTPLGVPQRRASQSREATGVRPGRGIGVPPASTKGFPVKGSDARRRSRAPPRCGLNEGLPSQGKRLCLCHRSALVFAPQRRASQSREATRRPGVAASTPAASTKGFPVKGSDPRSSRSCSTTGSCLNEGLPSQGKRPRRATSHPARVRASTKGFPVKGSDTATFASD